MTAIFWMFLFGVAVLFGLKLTFVASTALVLPRTGGALFVGTSSRRIRAFLNAVPMESNQTLVDLGCGDGRVLRMARRRYGVRAVGFEINPMAYLQAKILCAGWKGVEVRRVDFRNQDLSFADVIFCYLFPDVLRSLAPKLETELKAGSWIASCNFPIPGFSPHRILRPTTRRGTPDDPIYLYRVEGKKESHGLAIQLEGLLPCNENPTPNSPSPT